MNVTDMITAVVNVKEGEHSIRPPQRNINPIAFSVSMGIVTCLGVLGNLFTLIIFSMKKFNAFSYSVYFRMLAVVDTVLLCLELYHVLESSLKPSPPESPPPNMMDNRKNAQINCIVRGFIADLARMMSSSLYIIIPFDRIIVCVMPFKFKKFAKPYTARIVCLTLAVFSVLMNVPEAIYLSTEADFSEYVDCKTYGNDALNKFRTFKGFGYSVVITFGLTLGFNFFLLFKIKSYLKIRKTIRANRSDEQNEARISASFIFVTLFSTLVYLPLGAFDVARRVAKTLPEDEAYKILETSEKAKEPIIVLAYLNYAANFYILFILWKSIRDAFKSLLHNSFGLLKKETYTCLFPHTNAPATDAS